MKLTIIALILLTSTTVSFSKSKIKHFGIANKTELTVSSYIVKDAEYVVANLRIRNDESDALKRLRLLEQARNIVEQKANEKEYITLSIYPVRINPTRSKLSMGFNKTYLNYRITVPIKYFENDYLVTIIALRKFVDSFPKIEDTDYYLSDATLAILNPNDYKIEIMQKIKKEYKELQSIFGDNIFLQIKNCEKLVSVVELDNLQVGLYINYSIEIMETK